MTWCPCRLATQRDELRVSRRSVGQEMGFVRQVAGRGRVIDQCTACRYTMSIQLIWDEAKRKSNLRDHGVDFLDAKRVSEGLTYTYEDDRLRYGEQRFVTLGLLAGIPVSVTHAETGETVRVIAFRRATNHEAEILFSQIKDQLPPPAVDDGQRRPDLGRAPRNRPKARRARNRASWPKGRPT